MKCNFTRLSYKTYCSNDFKYSVELYKETAFQEREYNKYDTGSLYEKKYNIRCGFEKVNTDFEINGETINPRSILRLVASVFKRTEINEIKNNIRNYFIKYNGQEYDIIECDYINGDSTLNFFFMNCEKRVNLIKE